MRSPRVGLWADRGMRFGLGLAANAVYIVASIARNKWVASHFQTTGIGVVGQLNAAQTWLGLAASMGLGIAVMRLTGAAFGAGDAPAARRITWSALALCGISTAVACVLGAVFAVPLATALLGDAAYAPLVRVSLIGAAGYAFYAIITGLFAGRSDVRAPFTLAVFSALASTIAIFTLVPRAGLAGAVLGVSIIFPAGVIGALLVHRRDYGPLLGRPPRPLIDAVSLRAMLLTGGAALTLALLDQGTLLALRAHYLRHHGVDANGLFQSALAFAQQVGGVFYVYLSNYAFGRISAAPDAGAMRDYTRRHWTPLLGMAVAAFAAAIVLGRPLLHLLYSDRFDPAAPMLAWMSLGEFGKVALQVWALAALPLAGPRLWLPLMLAFPAGLVASYGVLGMMGAGIERLPLAYMGAGLIALLVNGTVMTRRGVGLRARDVLALIAMVALLAALAMWRVGWPLAR